ncbi:MAG: ABC transporter substrate-binding protein [Deltaproteobacteria bacterium]|nr:ABC transporter substrate-binding protein [Deltaproteobacteria bacterium]
MNLRKLLCVVSLIACCLPRLAWAASPSDTVKQLLDAMRSYKTATGGINAGAQKVVEGTLPIQDLSKQVLGAYWAKLNAAEQKNFVQLLQDLLKKVAYPKSAEFFGDLQIEVVNERVRGTEAVVETMVSHPKEGQVTIEYKLQQAGERWTVSDILLDGVSLVTNVRTQMQQVITKESYQGLLKRMREKLTES